MSVPVKNALIQVARNKQERLGTGVEVIFLIIIVSCGAVSDGTLKKLTITVPSYSGLYDLKTGYSPLARGNLVRAHDV